MPLLWQIVLLALVQGICEFLPVSSSGHLVIAQTLLRYAPPPLATDIFLHLGTLLAVVVFFFGDLKAMAMGWRDAAQRRLIGWLLLASLPTAAIGLLFKHPLERLFSTPAAVGVGLLVTAAVLAASRRLRVRTPPMALAVVLIGVAQGLAIAPGVSRAGLTIAAALVMSMERDFAFRFSFLLSLPAVAGALLLEWRQVPGLGGGLPLLLLGAALAALVGYLALGWLQRVLRHGHFHLFAVYCLAAGLLVLLWLR